MTVIAADDDPAQLWATAFAWLRTRAQQQAVPLSAAVVLVPYAQLMAQARRHWQALFAQGFEPRFETTRNWAGQFAAPPLEAAEYTGERARDTLAARVLLEGAGLGAHAELLIGPLLDMAGQLAAAVAVVEPARRAAWAEQARALLPVGEEGSPLRLEATAARVALEWVLASRHSCDVLFTAPARASARLLLVVEGLQPDPLAQALLAHWGDDGCAVPLRESAPLTPARIALHAAEDAEAEAQRAAACVLAHLGRQRSPVALVAVDRALTRRVSALLQQTGVPLQDESGWTLSTTRAAAQLMALLRAAAWGASSDEVLDWLKHCPAAAPAAVRALERWLRRHGAHRWKLAAHELAALAGRHPLEAALAAQCEDWRTQLHAHRPLADWLAALRALLQATLAWTALEGDPAGAAVLSALHLLPGLDIGLRDAAGAQQRLDLGEFTRWASDVLECARHRPEYPAGAPVVVLPLAQLLGREFAALVMPGCDEKRLPAVPEPPGAWSAAQRQALGLPTRDSLLQAQRLAWGCALKSPWVDVLWRAGEGGEPLLPSALVQALQLEGLATDGADACTPRAVAPTPVVRPAIDASALQLQQLSSSAYDDLRQCPYRFFVRRLLRLQDDDELDGQVDKRDFGTWLHAVLQHFHEALAQDPGADAGQRATLMDAAAERAQHQLRLQPGDFLPYRSGWPELRKGYLDWLAQHETGLAARFEQAERHVRQRLPGLAVELVGSLDRVDRLQPAGAGAASHLLIDYKTEGADKTSARVQPGSEDTQLAFYAALMPPGTQLRAAYVNVGERGATRLYEQAEVLAQREQLQQGIADDLQRIAGGTPLQALGEGSVCEWCNARGLCRRDFWT